MQQHEFEAWMQQQRRDAGRWNVDPIHNGRDRDELLVYCPCPDDPTTGLYVSITPERDRARPRQCLGTYAISTGRFHDAVPHIGEAFFRPKVQQGGFGSLHEARLHAAYRLGLPFLLALPHARPEGRRAASPQASIYLPQC
jgi:hypothetical protein